MTVAAHKPTTTMRTVEKKTVTNEKQKKTSSKSFAFLTIKFQILVFYAVQDKPTKATESIKLDTNF